MDTAATMATPDFNPLANIGLSLLSLPTTNKDAGSAILKGVTVFEINLHDPSNPVGR
jgi:hypothetical protein